MNIYHIDGQSANLNLSVGRKKYNLCVFIFADASNVEDLGQASKQSNEAPPPPLIGVVTPLVNTNLKVDAKPFIPKTSSAPEQSQRKRDLVPAGEDKSSESGKHIGSSPSDLQPFELPKTKDDTLHVYVVNVANPHNFSVRRSSSFKVFYVGSRMQ